MTDTKDVAPSGRKRPPRAGIGRPKGIPNKTTQALKDAILMAAEQVGQDGAGKDGLTGYLRKVATEDVKAFSTLLGKVLPMTVAGDPDNPVRVVFETVYEGQQAD